MKTNKHYCNVTLEDMQNVLKSDKGWSIKTEQGTKEYVFQFPLSNHPYIVIKVCSGIVYNGQSRGCGQDAIRIFAINTKTNKGWIKTKRVYRIGTWEKNLKKAVMEVFEQSRSRFKN